MFTFMLEFWNKSFTIMLGSCFLILSGLVQTGVGILRVEVWFAVRSKSDLECGFRMWHLRTFRMWHLRSLFA